jgi:D-amino peptidase
VKIFISADIEGVAGVVTPLQGQPGNAEYERARRLMTEEVNAAIDGAFAGGADSVLVNDAHGPGTNLLPDELDPRAELIIGRPKPMSMFAGLEAGFGGAFCTGYHAGAGHFGVLSHTVSGAAFAAIRVNGTACAEATLYGAYAGELGVPVLLLTGDDQLAEQCGPLFPAAQVAVVKHAIAHRAARALSPQSARTRIRAAAEAAVKGAGGCSPFVIPGPYRLELDLITVTMADLAGIIPLAERIGPRTVAFAATSMQAVVRWVNTVSTMCASLR